MNFYCQKICGEEDFSIEEWTKVSQELDKTNLSEKDKQDILFPAKCGKQCFDCMAIVGERQTKTKQLLKS
ncbi:hypothetical protein [Sphingobacterium thalpophilum]|uniref:hypothetical protein n=1 Tax=Sphingobacterium thalpophilum TaxID=259 RepID=UPI0024A6ABD8|nr:hypothetical protein [Sphingobacterium thalpophilum]